MFTDSDRSRDCFERAEHEKRVLTVVSGLESCLWVGGGRSHTDAFAWLATDMQIAPPWCSCLLSKRTVARFYHTYVEEEFIPR